jgi:hypothetical protein
VAKKVGLTRNVVRYYIKKSKVKRHPPTRDAATRAPWSEDVIRKRREIKRDRIMTTSQIHNCTMDLYKKEMKHVRRFDESRHWSQHPEIVKYVGLAIAKHRYNKFKGIPEYRLKIRMRTRLWKVLKLQCQHKRARTFNFVGCSPSELKVYIERQFVGLMQWNNYGSLWEIDHIRPCASFDLSSDMQVRACFHYSNLRPLLKTENRSKSSNYGGLHHKHRWNKSKMKSEDTLMAALWAGGPRPRAKFSITTET